MDNLSPESKALYELLKSDTKEEYESRFLQYKKEMLDAVKLFVDDTTSQIKDMEVTVEELRSPGRQGINRCRARLRQGYSQLRDRVVGGDHGSSLKVLSKHRGGRTFVFNIQGDRRKHRRPDGALL